MANSETDYINYASIVLGIILLLVFALTLISHNERLNNLEKADYDYIGVRLEQPEFLYMDPKEGLLLALEYYNIPEAEIVYTQAYIGTSNFNKYNQNVNSSNLFGFYDNKAKRYMVFDHWVGSVICYKNKFSDNYKSGDYYNFLMEMGYDSIYINKVKQVRKQLFNHD